MPDRRFPPPWSVEEHPACEIVQDHNGFALAYVYYEEEPGRRDAAKLLTKDEARRIALGIAKLARSGAQDLKFAAAAGSTHYSSKHVRPVLVAHFVGKAPGRQAHQFGEWRCDRRERHDWHGIRLVAVASGCRLVIRAVDTLIASSVAVVL